MSNAGFGQGPKTETVYGGPAPAARGTVYGGPTTQTAEGTVYNGPVGGTVYQGPAATPTIGPRSATRTGITSNAAAVRGARIFYLVAGMTVLRTVLIFAGVQILTKTANLQGPAMMALVAVNATVVAIFVLLGFFAQRGSKIAFLIGMLIYAADLVLLLVNNAVSNVFSIVIHGLVLYYLFSNFRQLPE